jgi:hypothetical protein
MYPDILKIEPTKRSPWIVLEPGRIFMMGRSIIENPSEFYEPGLEWVSAFIKSWTGKTKIDLGFEYINTGSIKWLYILLRELSEIREMSENAVITWYYEEGDDDMCELGFILRSLVDCSFTIIEVDEMSHSLYKNFLEGSN